MNDDERMSKDPEPTEELTLAHRAAVDSGAAMLGARFLELLQVWAVCHDGQWMACHTPAIAHRARVQKEVDAAALADPHSGRSAHAEWLRSGPFIRPLPHYLVNSDDEIIGIMQSLRAT